MMEFNTYLDNLPVAVDSSQATDYINLARGKAGALSIMGHNVTGAPQGLVV